MKAKQRHDLATNALARELEGLPDKLKRWANTLLTVVLIVAAVGLLVRWRILSAAQARQDILTQLATAQTGFNQVENDLSAHLPDPPYTPIFSPQHIAEERAAAVTQVRDAIATVLNNSSDPKFKAAALVARGDLYWQLANFPPLPGTATQPFLQPEESADQYLAHAADSYQQVLSGDAYHDQHDSIISARFGLAAIAENRHDWTTALDQLQRIIDDSDATPPLRDLATRQRTALPQLQTTLYLSPSAQPTTAPSTQPLH